MRLKCQILPAVLLDLPPGDPRRAPHPVRLVGGLGVLRGSGR